MDAMQVLTFVRRQSAPVVIGVVLVLFLMFLAATNKASPEAKLAQILERLPPDVSVVLLPPGEPSRAEGLVASLLRLSAVSLPPPARPAALLAVEADGERRTLALVEGARARAAGVGGPAVSGFTIAGDQNAAARLAAEIQKETPGTQMQASLRQFLRNPQGSAELRLVLRPSSALSTFPPELRTALGSDPVGIRLRDEGRELRFSGLAPGRTLPAGLAAPILGQRIDDALLVLDGITVDDLLPSSLPPLLEALKAATGVRPEIDALAHTLRGAPGAIVLLSSDGGGVDLVGGFLRRARIDEVTAAARKLLEKRLALEGGVREVVRVGGRTIRHRRPPTTALIEQERDGWRVVRAPRAAGAADLVAAWNDAAFLLGTSEEAVLRVAPHLRAVPDRLDFLFSLQVARAKALAVVQQILAAFPLPVRNTFSVLEAVTLEVELPTSSGVRFRGSVRFAAP